MEIGITAVKRLSALAWEKPTSEYCGSIAGQGQPQSSGKRFEPIQYSMATDSAAPVAPLYPTSKRPALNSRGLIF
jgi:hypothetical protein